ncbi:MAG: hypothetical protein AB7W16_20070 [Candidatus Obscuribacterales bacterium]
MSQLRHRTVTPWTLDDPFASLSLTSAEANAACGSRVDFKMVEGSDGAHLVKIGDGDPLCESADFSYVFLFAQV